MPVFHRQQRVCFIFPLDLRVLLSICTFFHVSLQVVYQLSLLNTILFRSFAAQKFPVTFIRVFFFFQSLKNFLFLSNFLFVRFFSLQLFFCIPVGEWKKQRGNLEKYTKEGAQNNKIAKTNKQRTKLSKLGQERKDTENALLIKLQINILSLAPGFFCPSSSLNQAQPLITQK